jgi:hypothetical protein
MKIEHIETIRERLGVAFVTIARYNRDHRDDIKDIRKIFYLKGDSKEKVLALLYMLSSGEEDEAVQKYREQTGFNTVEYDRENLFEKYNEYKVLLLTALIYNEAFYAMAMNFRGFVIAGLPVKEVEEDSLDLELVIDEEPVNGGKLPITIIIDHAVIHCSSPKEERNAAAPVHEEFREFFNEHIVYNDIGGTLYFMGNQQKQVYLEFVFDKYQDSIPFEFEYCFTTTRDHKEHSIVIPTDKEPFKDEEEGFTAIRSDLKSEIDYSGGIEPTQDKPKTAG